MKFYPKSTSSRNRVDEIDFIRGIAIILMVIYHWFSLLDLRIGSTYSNNLLVSVIGNFARTSFVILVGISSDLSRQNTKNDNKYIKKQLVRVLYLIIYALLLTIISKFAYPDCFIRFGILHYMAVALFLLTFMSLIPEYIPVIIGVFMLFTYVMFMKDRRTGNLFLNAIGFTPNYNTMDYFPIFRWFWLSAIGLYISKSIYKDGKRTYSDPYFDKNFVSRSLVTLGKYSLEIYLLHLPVIYFIQYFIYG
tara:strand:- start:96 stop:842 length:747 start_codon:yes stop_codon:yes gene_type:complete